MTCFEENSKVLIRKWTRAYASGALNLGIINQNKQREAVLRSDGTVVIRETCVHCNVVKDLTPMNFTPTNGAERIYESSIPGRESFSNSRTRPCRACWARLDSERKTSGKYFVTLLLGVRKYSKLRSSNWYMEQRKKQLDEHGVLRCAITNVPIYELRNADWSVSVQNNGDLSEHLPETCVLIAKELNVPEHFDIPLVNAWTGLFMHLSNVFENASGYEHLGRCILRTAQANWRQTPAQNGVTALPSAHTEYMAQLRKFHLRTMFQTMSGNCRLYDRAKCFDVSATVTAIDLYTILERQNGREHYTGIPFSLNIRDWNYPSPERIDNNCGHTTGNVVLTFKLLNTCGQFTRKKILFAFLQQKLVELSPRIREIAHQECVSAKDEHASKKRRKDSVGTTNAKNIEVYL